MNKNDLEWLMNEFYNTNERSKQSLTGYYEMMSKVRTTQKTINRNNKYLAEVQEKIKELEDKRLANNGNLTLEQEKQMRVLLSIESGIEKSNNKLSQQLATYKDINKTTNLIVASLASMDNLIMNTGKFVYRNSGYFLDQMRAVRNTEKSMGILSSQTASFRDNLYKASFETNKIGVDTRMLADIQSQYSMDIGRSIAMGQDSLESSAKMIQDSGMAVSTFSKLVGLTDRIGVNIVNTSKEFNDLNNQAMQMGINQTKAIEKVETIMSLVGKYSFKNGIESMKRMAIESAKYKTNIDEIAGLADKLFDVEGAINLSAQLQVLGGKWAQISDPMQLMFKARNDLEGLQKDVISAMSDSAQWSEVNQQFEISALELHRMRGVAQMTGLSLEHLRDVALETAKASRVKMQIGGMNFSEKEQDLISSLAEFQKDGTFVMKIDGKDINSRDLYKYATRISQLVKEQKEQGEKAEDAMLFDEKVKNLINSYKSLLLPAFEALDKGLKPLIQGFSDWIQNSGGVDKIREYVSHLSQTIDKAMTWMNENLMNVGKIALAYTAFKGLIIGVQWFSMGATWAKGVKSVLGNFVNGVDGSGNSLGGNGSSGNSTRGRRKGLGRFINPHKAGLKGGAVGLASGLLVQGAFASGLVDEESDAGKGLDTASTVLSTAGTGAMIGSFFTPVGTVIGAGIGALVGAGMSYFEHYADDNKPKNKSESSIKSDLMNLSNAQFQKDKLNSSQGMANDFILRAGQDPIKFSSADSLIGMKKDGGIGKAVLGQGKSTINSDKIKVSFDNSLRIVGEIILKDANSNVIGRELWDNPTFQVEVTRMVQEQLSKNLSGGIRTSTRLQE